MAKLTQADLLEIYDAVSSRMRPYEKGVITAKLDIQGKYDLWTNKKVMAHGKMRDEVSFVTAILQSSYVGFYFMPIYTNPEEMRAMLNPGLLKMLKGKACFHIKDTKPETLKWIEEAMAAGYERYRKNEWL
jgi:hypothetical protein